MRSLFTSQTKHTDNILRFKTKKRTLNNSDLWPWTWQIKDTKYTDKILRRRPPYPQLCSEANIQNKPNLQTISYVWTQLYRKLLWSLYTVFWNLHFKRK